MMVEGQSSQGSARNRLGAFAAILSLLSMSAGIGAIYESFVGDYVLSASLIFLGVLLDFLDGYVAKRWSCESAFGRDLDSFGDFTVSGLAVFFLAFNLFSSDVPGNIVFILIPVAAAVRLARFNTAYDPEYFIGVPTFVTGISFSSLVAAGAAGFEASTALAVVLSFLMVSEIRIATFAGLKKRVHVAVIMGFVAILAASLILAPLAAFFLIWLFVLASALAPGLGKNMEARLGEGRGHGK